MRKWKIIGYSNDKEIFEMEIKAASFNAASLVAGALVPSHEFGGVKMDHFIVDEVPIISSSDMLSSKCNKSMIKRWD